MRLHLTPLFKRFGKQYDFKKKSKTVTNDFYQTGTVTYTTTQYYAIIVPARAYNIHSNLFSSIKDSGQELSGIVDIYVNIDTGLDVDDICVDGSVEYEIFSIEKWEEYEVLGAKRK